MLEARTKNEPDDTSRISGCQSPWSLSNYAASPCQGHGKRHSESLARITSATGHRGSGVHVDKKTDDGIGSFDNLCRSLNLPLVEFQL